MIDTPRRESVRIEVSPYSDQGVLRREIDAARAARPGMKLWGKSHWFDIARNVVVVTLHFVKDGPAPLTPEMRAQTKWEEGLC